MRVSSRRPGPRSSVAFGSAPITGPACLFFACWILESSCARIAFVEWLRGEEAGARAHLDQMHRHADGLGQPFSVAYAHVAAMMLHQLAGDAEGVRAAADALLAAGTEEGFGLFGALARCCRGWALAVGAGQVRGVAEMRAGIAHWRSAGAAFLLPYQLGLLAEAEAAAARPAAALSTIEEALGIAQRTGERWWEPELLRVAGELQGARARRLRGAARTREYGRSLASLRKAACSAGRSGAAALVARARASLARFA